MNVLNDLKWAEIAGYLNEIPGYTASPDGGVEQFLRGDVSSGMFFKVEYEPGEIIMPQGVCTDFAGLLLEGCVKVVDAPRINQFLTPPLQTVECWKPTSRWWRRFTRLFIKTPTLKEAELGDPIGHGALDDNNSRYIGRRKARDFKGDEEYDEETGDESGEGRLRPVLRRLIGLTGAMWNTPRTYTLVAEDDRHGKHCTLLLIKRKVLLTIESRSAEFRRERKAFFLEKELPGQLLSNRLFANTLYPDEFTHWPDFVQSLKAPTTRFRSPAVHRIRSHWDHDFRRWFDGLDEENLAEVQRYEVLRGLNRFLCNDGLFDEVTWNQSKLPESARRILQIDPGKRTRNEVVQLNRCLYEATLSSKIHPSQELGPLSRGDFVKYVEAIRAIAKELEQTGTVKKGEAIQLLHFDLDPKRKPSAGRRRKDLIYSQDTCSDGLYLLLSGRVKITQQSAGGDEEILLNHLSQHGFFGLSCLRGRDARHSATVTAMSQVDVCLLHRELVFRLAERFSFLDRKLKRELERLDRRAALRRLPPLDPPERLASKLMAATNLLRIDMDLCTRCDKCVQACSDAHGGVSRFHRSRPDQRFYEWEIAGACVHCEDPPCQKACPVGAITVEFDSTVQVHRNRCIGCTLCAGACPFDVVRMLRPLEDERTSPARGVELNGVATKCDLCLAEAKDPPCVMACPYGAAERGAPRKLFPGIKSWSQIAPT